MIKVAITGPESTGKSMLAKQLADCFGGKWVPEYARIFIDQLDRAYVKEDLVSIAKGQLELEKEIMKDNPSHLFSDTELTVIKIWSEFKYAQCDPWIFNEWQKQKYDLYLLMDVDLPWQEDPQREHPHARRELFKLYHDALAERGVPFKIIRGIGESRLECAKRAIYECLKA